MANGTTASRPDQNDQLILARLLSDLVRAVVVHHQMHFKAARKIGLDLIEKPQELLMPVPPVARSQRIGGGCNPKARQIRTIAFCGRPISSAMRRVLQCVLLAGIDSSVFVTTFSIC